MKPSGSGLSALAAATGLGSLCRDYTISGVLDGKLVMAEGWACRRSDGSRSVG